MEVYAGFLEQTDTEAGRIIDELDKQGIRENTLIFYILSDNGASAEGIRGHHKRTAGAERHPNDCCSADRRHSTRCMAASIRWAGR